MSEGSFAEPPARRPRVSRPTPSHLFAQRQVAETAPANSGEVGPRATRAIPALAATDDSAPADAPPLRSEPPPTHVEGLPEYPPDLVFIVSADGTVLYVNRPVGPRGEEDVIGSDLYDWIFPDQHAVVRKCLARVFASGCADGHDLHGIQQHDADAWYECRISPNLRGGSVVSATIIARDVTRYKRSEEALLDREAEAMRLLAERSADLEKAKTELAARRNESNEGQATLRRFRPLLDEAGEAIFITDGRSRRLIDVNETACRWLRRPREELIGHEVRGLGLEFQVLPPAELDRQFTETRDTQRPLILDGGIHRRTDGSTFPVEVTVAHHTDGENEYVLAVVRDVKGRRAAEEALRESEARYRSLFEQSWDAVYLTTRAGEIVEANAAALALFGYGPDGLIGMDARELLPNANDIRTFQQQMAEGGSVHDLEVQLRAADGHRFPGRVSASCRRDPDGTLRGYQWLVRREQTTQPVTDAGTGTAGAAGTAATRAPRATVLIIEHEDRVLAEARSALEHAGMRVLTAATPERGLEVYQAHRDEVAAMVLEAALGESASGKVVREVRRLDPDAQIVLVSPDDPSAVAERFSQLGIGAYLRKPAHPLTLVQTVRDLLHSSGNGA